MSEMSIEAVFTQSRRLAIVGLSDNPARTSHQVASYLARFYDIVPVNPTKQTIMERVSYPGLADVPGEVDMAVMFQRSEDIMRHVAPAIEKGVRIFWMQLGIRNAEAAKQLQAAGIFVVQDRCTMVDHRALGFAAPDAAT